MENENNDDAGSDFGDDLQYDVITPNFGSRSKISSRLSIGETSQPVEKQVKILVQNFIQISKRILR